MAHLPLTNLRGFEIWWRGNKQKNGWGFYGGGRRGEGWKSQKKIKIFDNYVYIAFISHSQLKLKLILSMGKIKFRPYTSTYKWKHCLPLPVMICINARHFEFVENFNITMSYMSSCAWVAHGNINKKVIKYK